MAGCEDEGAEADGSPAFIHAIEANCWSVSVGSALLLLTHDPEEAFAAGVKAMAAGEGRQRPLMISSGPNARPVAAVMRQIDDLRRPGCLEANRNPSS